MKVLPRLAQDNLGTFFPKDLEKGDSTGKKSRLRTYYSSEPYKDVKTPPKRIIVPPDYPLGGRLIVSRKRILLGTAYSDPEEPAAPLSVHGILQLLPLLPESDIPTRYGIYTYSIFL